MNIRTSSFGKTSDGHDATLYTLTNSKGMTASFTDYGANIVSICVPDRNDKAADIALGFDSVSGYEHNAPGYGSFIGRVGNRIAGAKFTINGIVYNLEKNDGNNTLHGGKRGYNTFMYDAEIFKDSDSISIEFSRLSPDMEQGFPGNLDLTVTYTLTENNELMLEYFAVSDKDTIINFTNHSYFNLAGNTSGTVLNHKLMLDSDYFTLTNDELIPTGKLGNVTGTPMDFRKMKRIGQDIEADYEPLKLAGGYDHNYVLKTTREEASKVAELYEENSGRCMEVFTDMPGMQLYSGNFIMGDLKGKNGCVYQKRDGICFESQFYPNSCNIPEFPSCSLRAGVEFDSTTIYKFSTRNN